MVNSRAKMKVWPLIIVCMSTGAVHTELCHNYGAEAFLLQWDYFTSIRGDPTKVFSDKGSQLTAAANYVTVPVGQDLSKWNWDLVTQKTARVGTTFLQVASSGKVWLSLV